MLWYGVSELPSVLSASGPERRTWGGNTHNIEPDCILSPKGTLSLIVFDRRS